MTKDGKQLPAIKTGNEHNLEATICNAACEKQRLATSGEIKERFCFYEFPIGVFQEVIAVSIDEGEILTSHHFVKIWPIKTA